MKIKNTAGENKEKTIAELWCKWNARELTGDEFAYEFGRYFKKEINPIWINWLKLREKIKEEMVREGRFL